MSALSKVTTEELASWRGYIGRQETRRQLLDTESLRRFAAAVGSDLDVERRPPPLAHWAFFLDVAGSVGLGSDGHPLRGGGLLPAVHLPRRMFAASTIRLIERPSFSRDAEMILSVVDVKHRKGRSGDLVLVDVDRVLIQEGRERVAERQTIVYRDAQVALAPVQEAPAAPSRDEGSWTPGPVELFRFSAATFNSHRIHYDLPYARDVEGYPGLVVQGPLTATRLFQYLANTAPGNEPLRRFEFKALAPLFAEQPVRLVSADHGRADAVRCDGTIAMSASAQ